MKCPTLLLSATGLLLAGTASAQAVFLEEATASIGTWYAVLIGVFAVLVGVGLVSTQRDEQDHNRRSDSPHRSDGKPRHSGSADAPTLRRSKNADQ